MTGQASIDAARLAFEQAIERFCARAVSELWLLRDRLPPSAPLEDRGGSPALSPPMGAWHGARQRHSLARHGLILRQGDPLPTADPKRPARYEEKPSTPSLRLA